MHDKVEYVIHTKNLKQAFHHGLVLKNVHRVIKVNQKAWLKPYIDMNAELRRKAKKKKISKKQIKSMNNVVFGKAMEKIIKNS